MRRTLCALTLGAGLLSGLFAEGQTEVPPSGAAASIIVITDYYGRDIVLDAPPRRVVSVSPTLTETVYALRKGDLLVGRTDYCDWPAEAGTLPSVGTITEPNLEVVISLEPDIVLVSNHFREESASALEEAGVVVAALFAPESFEGTYDNLLRLGTLLEAEEQAATLVADMRRRTDAVVDAVAGRERPRVYYVVGFGEWGDYTAGGDTFIGQMIELAGGENVAADLSGWSYSLEKLIEDDPDLLVVSRYWDTKAGLMAADGYRELRAVREGRVYEIDNNLLDRQGPRVVEGLENLAALLHPGILED